MVPSGRASSCVLLTLVLGFLVGHASAGRTHDACASPLGRQGLGPRDPARGVVAVAHQGRARPSATGIVIASDRVVTCRHVVEVRGAGVGRLDPESLEVRVRGGAVVRRFPVRAYVHLSERVDLCVLEIGPDEGGQVLEADRALVFSRRRAALGDGLYTIHHPRGAPLRTDGGAQVLFPYEATAAEVDRVVARERASAVDPLRVLADIRASYVADGRGAFVNRSRRWAGQPALGTDLATKDGSSGAPVFDAATHVVVGMVFAGPGRGAVDGPPSWDRHEAVLPSAWILDDLAGSADPACRALSRGR